MLNKEYKRNRHSFYRLEYNLVVSIYQDRSIINHSIEKYLKYVIEQNFEKQKCELIEVKVEAESKVIINFSAPPHIKLSALVNNFKTVSSRLIRKEFKVYLDDNGMDKHLWDMEYYIST